MLKLEFTDSAELDLEAISEYTVEHFGLEQAHVYLHQLHDLLITLADNPKLGLPRDTLGTGIQSFPFKSHNIFYCCNNVSLSVLRILHSSRDPVRHIS